MPRNRRSAKQAGARFERAVADHLAQTIDTRIDRQVKRGALDRGDIAGLTDTHGHPITVECKDYGGRLQPAQWVREAHTEAHNAGAHVGIVIAKRRGTTDPVRQWALSDLTKAGIDPLRHRRLVEAVARLYETMFEKEQAHEPAHP